MHAIPYQPVQTQRVREMRIKHLTFESMGEGAARFVMQLDFVPETRITTFLQGDSSDAPPGPSLPHGQLSYAAYADNDHMTDKCPFRVAHTLSRLYFICGVTDCCELQGKQVLVAITDGKIVALGHRENDLWFVSSDEKTLALGFDPPSD